MKKLAAFLTIPALVLLVASTASAFRFHHWGGIHGTYAMIATGSCLHSTGGFDNQNQNVPDAPPAWTPQSNSVVWGATTMAQATWTFKSDGTGAVLGTNYVIDFPPDGSPSPPFSGAPVARQNPIAFSFGYVLTPDGEVEVKLPNGFVLAVGRISIDHKTMTLWSANVVQPWKINNVQYGDVICNTGRLLIRVKEVDD